MNSFFLGLIVSLIPLQEVDDILEAHFSASGQELFSSFRTQVIEGKIIQNSNLEYSFVTHLKRKNKIRHELSIGSETIVEVLNGTGGWYMDFNNKRALSVDEALKLRLQGLIDNRLFYLKNQGVIIRSLGKKNINDLHYYHLQADYEGIRMNFFIDENSNLLYRTIEESLGSDLPITETTFYNYKDFGGIQIPTITRVIGPQGRFQTRIEKVAFDVAAPSSLFERPY